MSVYVSLIVWPLSCLTITSPPGNRGIMEVLELMELDWANFQIELIRPQLQQESIEYERKKFNEFLQRQSSKNV